MNQEYDDAERFRRVWQRVQGSADGDSVPVRPDAPPRPELPGPEPPRPQPPKPQPDRFREAEFLRRAIDETVCRRAACGRFSRLQGLANRCGGQVRRLTAALFLLTGERYRPRGQCPKGPTGLLETGRMLYFQFRDAEDAYRDAARRTEEPSLRALFQELAGECGICREQVRRIIEGIV